jgi:hypothetical protein
VMKMEGGRRRNSREPVVVGMSQHVTSPTLPFPPSKVKFLSCSLHLQITTPHSSSISRSQALSIVGARAENQIILIRSPKPKPHCQSIRSNGIVSTVAKSNSMLHHWTRSRITPRSKALGKQTWQFEGSRMLQEVS